jgi:hypothetical protein
MDVSKASRSEKEKSMRSIKTHYNLNKIFDYFDEHFEDYDFELVKTSYTTLSKDDYSASIDFTCQNKEGSLEVILDKDFKIEDWDASINIYQDDEITKIIDLTIENNQIMKEELVL